MKQIPNRLQNTEFRFYLVGGNGKLPIEKKWNSDNNYPYFHTKVINHLKAGGNLGIVTGIARLIVLDFDNWDFYLSVKDKLPKTFTIKTAKSKKPHYYYILEGEMIRKIGINDKDKNRLMDIQAARSGVICPPSVINRKYYSEYLRNEIANITISELKAIFDINPQAPTQYTGVKDMPDNDAVNTSIKILEHNNIIRTGQMNWKCPFHDSKSGKSLYMFENAHIHCFHCERHYSNVHRFIDDLIKWKQ